MSLIRGVLLAGMFRTQHELNGMTNEDQRNTLIVGLHNLSNQPIQHFQGMNNDTLAGAGAVLAFLRQSGIRNDSDLKKMSDDDQRNTLIVELDAQTKLGGSLLQGMNNLELVLLGLGKMPPNSLNQGSFVRGVLLAGKFLTQHQLNSISADHQRNALISQLGGLSSQTNLQSFNDFDLAGMGAALVFLRASGIRNDSDLKKMSVDNQRNTLIVEVGAQTHIDGAKLQGLRTMDLIRLTLGVDPAIIFKALPGPFILPTDVLQQFIKIQARTGGVNGPVGVAMGDVRQVNGQFVRTYSGGVIELKDFTDGPQGFRRFRGEVRFVGFRCHKQSEDQLFNDGDEPYFIVGVQGGGNAELNVTKTFGPFSHVMSLTNTSLEAMVTTTAQPPITITVVAMENDSGIPAEASAKVEKTLNDASAKLTLALPLLGVDPEVGAYIQSFVNILGEPIADGFSSLLGLGDDLIGQNAKHLIEFDSNLQVVWKSPPQTTAPDFHNPFNIELVLDNGEGGRYSAFLQLDLFIDTVEKI